MKKVVLLGDSIRLIGYGPYVQEELGDEYQVWQPTDNCEFAQRTLRMLFDYQNQIKDADIIHWNNGHWDLCHLYGDDKPFTPPEVYREELLRIAEILLRYTKKIIFATTTPIDPSYEYNDNETINLYNKIAIDALTPLGIQINDLNSTVAADMGTLMAEDKLHLSEKGSKVCAKQVADMIKNII